MEVSEQLTGFELEDLMSWTVSTLRRPFREDFSLKKAASSQKKNHKYWGVVLSALTGRKKRRPFLKADGLEDGYKVLADFNGTVLAGVRSKHGVQWRRSKKTPGIPRM